MEEPLFVSVCKNCSRSIITAQFATHRENCEVQAPAPVVQPQAKRPRSGTGTEGGLNRLTLTRPGPVSGAPAAKRQAIEARRPLRFVHTREIQPVTERGAAPVPALCPPRMQQFPFQLGSSIPAWQSYHSAQQARLPDGNILSARVYGTGGPLLTGIVGGVGAFSMAQYGNVWLPTESNGTAKKGAVPTPKASAAAAAAAAAGTKGIGDNQSILLRRLFTPEFTNQLHDIPRTLFLHNRLGEIPLPQAMVAINGQQGYKPAASGVGAGAVPGPAQQQAQRGGKTAATPKSPAGRGRGSKAQQSAARQLQQQQQQQQLQQQYQQQQQQLRAQMMAPRSGQ